MVNYQDGKIYKIVCNKTGKFYIGSTTMKYLCSRLGDHVKAFKKQKTSYTSFEILKNGDYSIMLLEKYPCNTKEELFAREKHHILNSDCVNIQLPGNTMKEYYQQHKEEILHNVKVYRENNIEKINEYDRNRKAIKITCDCGTIKRKGDIIRHNKTQKHLDFMKEKNSNIL